MKIDYDLHYYYESLKTREYSKKRKRTKLHPAKTYLHTDETILDYIRMQAKEDGKYGRRKRGASNGSDN